VIIKKCSFKNISTTLLYYLSLGTRSSF